MAEKKYVVAIDQGTTSSRCMVFDKKGLPVCSDQMEHAQIFPKPGWVEHDAMEIWSRTKDVIRGAMEKGRISPDEVEFCFPTSYFFSCLAYLSGNLTIGRVADRKSVV